MNGHQHDFAGNRNISAKIHLDGLAPWNSTGIVATGERRAVAVQYFPAHGVHGSCTLRNYEDPQGAGENWQHVLAFLDKALPR